MRANVVFNADALLQAETYPHPEVHGRPLPFDGIEFDPELRWVDTMNDVAFLISDLEHRERADLGRLALDASEADLAVLAHQLQIQEPIGADETDVQFAEHLA